MSRPEVRYFVHLISKLLPVIAVVHHQADVFHLELEGSGDLVHQGEGYTHNSTTCKYQIELFYYQKQLILFDLRSGSAYCLSCSTPLLPR